MMLSIILGSGIGLLHGSAGLLVYWWAVRLRPAQGIKVVVGALAVRLMAALAAVGAVITYVPVQVSAFFGGLFVAFVIMLAVDVWFVLRLSQ
jgi:hypothetical protein